MSPKKASSSIEDIQKILGEDFWDVLTDVLPYVGPRVDICKTENEILVVVELPGIQSPKDIMIFVEGHTLFIEGKITRDYVANEEILLKNERYAGPFKRKIQLPHESLFSQLHAAYKKGLLKIKIPLMTETEQIRQEIPIVFNDEHTRM